MATSFKEIKSLDLPDLEEEMLNTWESEITFLKSISTRSVEKIFSFYEGPQQLMAVQAFITSLGGPSRMLFAVTRLCKASEWTGKPDGTLTACL